MKTSMSIRVDHQLLVPGAIQGFRFFWAFYVNGFDQTRHCQDCFKGSGSRKFNTKTAQSGQSYLMNERESFRYLYICGVGDGPNCGLFKQNFHLALRACNGHREVRPTYNGYTVTAENAEALPIPTLECCWKGLPKKHAACKNFQFGVEYFGWRDDHSQLPSL